MFNTTRYGHYSSKTYNNNAGALIKVLAFIVVVCVFGGTCWALFGALSLWTEAVGQTWQPGNNDTLLIVIGGAIGKSIVLLTCVVGGLVFLALAPWLIRNFRVALNTPIPGQREQRINVIDAEPQALIEDSHGLLMDNAQEHYIDAAHLLADHQPVSDN